MVYLIHNKFEYALIKSDGGNRPYDVRQPAFVQGANSCGMAMPKDEDFEPLIFLTSGSFFEITLYWAEKGN